MDDDPEEPGPNYLKMLGSIPIPSELEKGETLTLEKLSNAIRKVMGWPLIHKPPACGCRGAVHTCNTIS